MAVKCPLCGYRFNPDDTKNLCKSCPMGVDCSRLCCPNCHYSWVENTSIVGGFLKFARKRLKLGRS